jgi:hypothetical protein
MRNNAKDANLPRRIDGRGIGTLSAASASTTAAATTDSDLPGWIDDPGGDAVPGSATASPAASGTQVRRKGLSIRGSEPMAPAPSPHGPDLM